MIRDLSRCARAALTLEQRDNLDCIHAHYGRPGGNVTAFGCAPATSRRSCLSGRDYGVQDEIDKAIDYVCEEHRECSHTCAARCASSRPGRPSPPSDRARHPLVLSGGQPLISRTCCSVRARNMLRNRWKTDVAHGPMTSELWVFQINVLSRINRGQGPCPKFYGLGCIQTNILPEARTNQLHADRNPVPKVPWARRRTANR